MNTLNIETNIRIILRKILSSFINIGNVQAKRRKFSKTNKPLFILILYIDKWKIQLLAITIPLLMIINLLMILRINT